MKPSVFVQTVLSLLGAWYPSVLSRPLSPRAPIASVSQSTLTEFLDGDEGLVEEHPTDGSSPNLRTLLEPRFETPPDELNVESSGAGHCVVGGSAFGSMGDAELIEYNYEVETLNPFNESSLSLLERDVASALLPLLFDNCTNSTGSRYLRSHRRLVTIGLSVAPADTILVGVPCTFATALETHDCNVVQGSTTLFTDGNTTGSDRDKVLGDIEARMNNGDFNAFHPDVVRVSFVPSVPFAPDGAVDDGTPQEDDSSTLQPFAYVFMALGGATVLFALLMFLCRRRQRDDPKDEPPQTFTQTPDLDQNGQQPEQALYQKKFSPNIKNTEAKDEGKRHVVKSQEQDLIWKELDQPDENFQQSNASGYSGGAQGAKETDANGIVKFQEPTQDPSSKQLDHHLRDANQNQNQWAPPTTLTSTRGSNQKQKTASGSSDKAPTTIKATDIVEIGQGSQDTDPTSYKQSQ